MSDRTMVDILQEQFFIKRQTYDQSGISLEQLKDEKVMEQLVTRRTAQFGGGDTRVGGANMMKWFGNLIAAHAYMYSIHDQWLTYSSFSFVEKEKEAEIQLAHSSFTDIVEEDREMFILEHLGALFTILRPVFENVAMTSGLPIQQVWGLLCNPFYHRHQAWLATADANLQQRLSHDLHLVRSLEPALFGLKRNPFDVSLRYVDSWWEPIEPVRLKVACCMSYLKKEGNYCFACPKMTKEQRAERAAQLRRKQL